MKILVVADLHSQKKILPPLAATVTNLQPAAVFCLGDLTIEGPSSEAYTEDFLEACGHEDRPVLYVSGNNDDESTLEIMKVTGCLLDYSQRTIEETRVTGLGYGPPHEPFVPNLRNALLLTHVPPRKDSVPESVSNIPAFHFAGHLHRFERVWSLGETTVVQVPTAMNFRAVLFTLPEGTIEFFDLILDER